MSLKIVILAFDGLEYDFVERFKLNSLKQKQYGKVSIPDQCYFKEVGLFKVFEAWSPYVWGAFLTGKLPSQIGLTKETYTKWNNSFLQFLKVIGIRLGMGKLKNKGLIFEKIGFKRETFSLIPEQTFLKYAKNPCLLIFLFYAQNGVLDFQM